MSEAVTALNRVKADMIADRDRASRALAEGGTYQEMSVMTTVWRVIDDGVRGIEKAVALLQSEGGDGDEC